MVVNIAPPPCLWIPEGNARTGSQFVINFFNGVNPGPTASFNIGASFTLAQQLIKQNPMPAGEWWWLPINPAADAAGIAACLKLPAFDWAVPGAPLPGVALPPLTLAQLAIAKMAIPRANKIIFSPAAGNTESNLPTFVRVTLRGRYETAANGMPYMTVTAQLAGVGATVWAEAAPLVISTSDSTAQLFTNGCGYLGSAMMASQPNAVAHTGPNGSADCGATFHQPGPAQITATMAWKTCWVAQVVNGPPPANCAPPVQGANLNQTQWQRNLNVREIQAANGGG
jgi:hypothetical protein